MRQLERDIDRDLEELAGSKTAWARLSIEHKIVMLRNVQNSVYEMAPQWVDAAAQAKGLRPGSPLAGEEWISGPWAVLYAIARYLRTLRGLALDGRVPLPAIHFRNDRTKLDVFPYDTYDRVLLNGIRAQVWMQPGVAPSDVQHCAAPFYKMPAPPGRVALILGAGNIASIAPLDVLYKMLAGGAVCMLKMNPVNDYLGPIFERALQPLVERGFLRFAYGGADVGEYLCAHPIVDEIHVTGSERTHNAIAFGAGSGKPLTSELGNVSPTIVVPGRWNTRDVQFQAENIATQKAHNAGFNCIASQVLILPRDWPQARELRDRVERVFAAMEHRPEYYPGATQRRTALAGPDSSLRTVVMLDHADIDHAAFLSEAFCGVLACVEIPGDLEAFVPRAVAFANDRLHGTLGANIIVHPQTLREHGAVMEAAVAGLRYGCVGVNAWTGVGYFITETPWGAYPGHTRENVGSGVGVVHNAYFLERTEKSVVYAPFRQFPKPVWFVTHKMAAHVGRALCDFEVARTPMSALKVAVAALLG